MSLLDERTSLLTDAGRSDGNQRQDGQAISGGPETRSGPTTLREGESVDGAETIVDAATISNVDGDPGPHHGRQIAGGHPNDGSDDTQAAIQTYQPPEAQVTPTVLEVIWAAITRMLLENCPWVTKLWAVCGWWGVAWVSWVIVVITAFATQLLTLDKTKDTFTYQWVSLFSLFVSKLVQITFIVVGASKWPKPRASFGNN
ncbi:hypothetical protein GLAREA_07473 [Glarea lozoyensis ATCC 20868]|uniref:Uncharacterized protein n=1 Tax=Glarea lozoyensis (strain ATCC 20868 / MF5171) TaxID=1116229 RepID=S3D3J9_GLAL2|nr:uncharacterized protein GLAREA_07473 [Glarea lozoyensis ATCC 20868]EPE32340.1 hypothetical protein GLAREA_07473 [Glarea lozoyensis ATCC 20868]